MKNLFWKNVLRSQDTSWNHSGWEFPIYISKKCMLNFIHIFLGVWEALSRDNESFWNRLQNFDPDPHQRCACGCAIWEAEIRALALGPQLLGGGELSIVQCVRMPACLSAPAWGACPAWIAGPPLFLGSKTIFLLWRVCFKVYERLNSVSLELIA